jgi:hypothetical protein
LSSNEDGHAFERRFIERARLDFAMRDLAGASCVVLNSHPVEPMPDTGAADVAPVGFGQLVIVYILPSLVRARCVSGSTQVIAPPLRGALERCPARSRHPSPTMLASVARPVVYSSLRWRRRPA